MDEEEEEEEKIVAISITLLPNMKYHAELDRLGGMTLDELLSCSVFTDFYEQAKDLLIDYGPRIKAKGPGARLSPGDLIDSFGRWRSRIRGT
jgi:hypothetical protein